MLFRLMPKTPSTVPPSAKKRRFIIGRKASTNISKVEGLTLGRDMKKVFRSFDEKGLSPEVRRAALINKYAKKDS
jgi:hypothetical protein